MDEESLPEGQEATTPFASWLQSMRTALGYKREADLARALKLPQSTVSRWSKGSRPSVEHLWRVSRAFKTDLVPLLALSGHIPSDPGIDLFAAPPEPPSATTETVRRIKDADMPAEMKEVLFNYWERRLAEERARVYSFINEFSGPPGPKATDMRAWMARAFESDMTTHVAETFLDLLTISVGRMTSARRRPADDSANPQEETDPRES